MKIQGACHCGNIAFELDWSPDPAAIPARACGCTFCVKHAGVWTSKPDGILRVRIADESQVSRYRFGTKTATFHICRTCGVPPLVTSAIDGSLYAVVNVNTFDEAARRLLQSTPVTFEGEDEAARLARRKRGWIADVRVEDAQGRTVRPAAVSIADNSEAP